jgi:glycosyltransferase involved in cell wall biosynthesis
MKILIIVPAFNEEESIATTLNKIELLRSNVEKLDVCVINDGSKDKTKEIVENYDVELINLPYNLGIGCAMQTGYKFASRNNYDIAIQFDADGQHNIEDFINLIEPLKQNKCDMVVGSRFVEKTEYKGSLLRRVGIYFFSNLLGLLTREKFTDPTSGYRAINKKVIHLFAVNYPKDYPEPEVLIFLHRKGYKIKEISVNMSERQAGKSSITPLKSVYYMTKVTISILMQNIIKG